MKFKNEKGMKKFQVKLKTRLNFKHFFKVDFELISYNF